MPFKPFSLAESIQAGQTLKMNQLKLQSMMGEMQRQRELKNIAQMSTVPKFEEYQMPEEQVFPGEAPIEGLQTQTGDEYSAEKNIENLQKAGFTKEALTLQQQVAGLNKFQRDELTYKNEQISRLLATVNDESSFEAAKKNAISSGLVTEEDLNRIGLSEYDPDAVQVQINKSRELEDILKTEGSPYGKINPKDYTSESLAIYDKTRDVADLVPRPKSPLVTISTGEKGLEAATKEYGRGVGEAATKRDVYAASAQKQKTQLQRVLVAIDRGAKTGKMEETLLEMKGLANSFGIDVKDLPEQELIRTVSNEMALRLRNPESGLGLTGNTSNRDLQFLKDSVVGLGRSEAGNKKIIELLNKFNDMTIAVAKEQSRIIMENGGKVPLDLNTRIMDFVDNYDFFTQSEMRAIERMTKGEKEDFGDLTDSQVERLKKLRKLQGAE